MEYTLLLGNATTAAKVGLFIDQHREALMVAESHLKPQGDRRPRQYLDRARGNFPCLVTDWNLMVPKDVLERSWGEVW